MPLTVSITGYVPPVGVPLTMAALRKLASGFTVSISGTVSGGEVVDGSITPAKVSPGAYFYGVATFASDVYTVTLSPPLTGLSNGVKILVKVNNANTATEASLVVNGLPSAVGAPIRKRLNTKLLAGELMAGSIVEFTYNSSGVAAHWEVTANTLLERSNCALTTGTVTAEKCSAFTLALDWDYVGVTQYTGRVFFARLHADCASTPTITIGTGSTKTLKFADNWAINPGALVKGQVIAFVYDAATDCFLLVDGPPRRVYGAGTFSGTVNAWTATVPGLPAALLGGEVLVVGPTLTNTGACSIVLTTSPGLFAHGLVPVRKVGNAALLPGDVKAGSTLVLVYDAANTAWVIQSPLNEPKVLAMAMFNGTSATPITPTLGYNIDTTNKITKHGTGDYTLNFANALPSANYIVCISIGTATAFGAGGVSVQGQVFDPSANQGTASVRIHTGSTASGNAADAPAVYVTIIGSPS